MKNKRTSFLLFLILAILTTGCSFLKTKQGTVSTPSTTIPMTQSMNTPVSSFANGNIYFVSLSTPSNTLPEMMKPVMRTTVKTLNDAMGELLLGPTSEEKNKGLQTFVLLRDTTGNKVAVTSKKTALSLVSVTKENGIILVSFTLAPILEGDLSGAYIQEQVTKTVQSYAGNTQVVIAFNKTTCWDDMKGDCQNVFEDVQKKIAATIPSQTSTTKVLLYYKNVNNDPKIELCEADTAIEREIPLSKSPLKDAINLLVTNQLTAEEKASGLLGYLGSDMSNKDVTKFRLKLAVIENNNTAVLTFDDPDYFSSGGSCAIGILSSQIEKTAKQFPGIKKVILQPEDRFQP